MGRISYETYNPEDLDLPNDTDFELEGIDEAYGSYQEYEAYLPDKVRELLPVSPRALEACASASRAIREAVQQHADSVAAGVVESLLPYVEAVSTVRLENYLATCTSALGYAAAVASGNMAFGRQAEVAAVDAVEALRAFALLPSRAVTLDDLCATNATFTRGTSNRAEYCGTLRERPVFVGRSLFDAEFVPPPADVLEDYVNDLVRFLNDDGDGLDPIAKAAIAHTQFVIVHPFEDGNGRTGRAIAQRVLRTSGLVGSLMLPVGAVMATCESEYVAAIERTKSLRGPADPSAVVEFFARCCEKAACQVQRLERRVEATLDAWEGNVPADNNVSTGALKAIASTPVVTEAILSTRLSTSLEDAHAVLDALVDSGVLRRRRSSFCGVDVYEAAEVLAILGDAQRMRKV